MRRRASTRSGLVIAGVVVRAGIEGGEDSSEGEAGVVIDSGDGLG